MCECEAGFQGDRYATSPDYNSNNTLMTPEDIDYVTLDVLA